jgi:valine--pyruvate aminotransferase
MPTQPPFPNIIFSEVKPFWNENTILCMSLSKLGLPGTRCGIVIGPESLIAAMGNLSGIINLAPVASAPAWCSAGLRAATSSV